MADRTCPKCDKKFAKPCLLRRHLQRVKPCAPTVQPADLPAGDRVKPYECAFCRRRFTQQSNVYVHMRTACRAAPREPPRDQPQDDERDRLMRQQAADIEHLRAQVQALRAAPPRVQIGNIVNGDVNVVLNVFGNEQTSHIGGDHVRSILDGILRTHRDPSSAALEALLRTALLIYSDPAHPENITCYIPNKKQTTAMVHVGGAGGAAWAVRPMQLVVPPMVQRSMDTLVREQPFEDADRYADIMRALIANEQTYQECGQLRAVLINNKNLLDQIVDAGVAASPLPGSG